MTEQSSLPDNYNRWYQQGSKQNNSRYYEEAINSFAQALQYDAHAHDA